MTIHPLTKAAYDLTVSLNNLRPPTLVGVVDADDIAALDDFKRAAAQVMDAYWESFGWYANEHVGVKREGYERVVSHGLPSSDMDKAAEELRENVVEMRAGRRR